MSERDLLAELKQKEKDLISAAEYGEGLLEDNKCLEQDLNALREDFRCLEELLESQKQESSKSRKLAELHISELEAELEGCRASLEEEREAANSTREEFRRSHRQLQQENAQLKEYLAQVLEKHEVEVQELSVEVTESRERTRVASVDHARAHHSLEELQGENQCLDKKLSSVSRSCERLSLELEDSRDTAGFWESQYHSQEELLLSQAKELDNSKNQLRLLQMQLDQKHLNGVMASRESLSSGMSLYEELSQLDEVEGAISYSSDNDSSTMEDDRLLTLRPVHTVAELSSGCEVMCKSNREDTGLGEAQEEGTGVRKEGGESELCGVCQRCQVTEAKNKQMEAELKTISDQLLLAAEQKFQLQQQLEQWQCDMETMVDLKLQHMLAKEKKRWRKSKLNQRDTRTPGKGKEVGCNEFHMLKDSWIF